MPVPFLLGDTGMSVLGVNWPEGDSTLCGAVPIKPALPEMLFRTVEALDY